MLNYNHYIFLIFNPTNVIMKTAKICLSFLFFGSVTCHLYAQGAGGFFVHSYSEKLKINEKRESDLKGIGGGGFGWLSENFALGGELSGSPISINREVEDLDEEVAKTESKEDKIEFEYSGSIGLIGLTADYALIKSDTVQVLAGGLLGALNYNLTRNKFTTKDGETKSEEKKLRNETELVAVPTFIARWIVAPPLAIELKYRHVPSKLEFKGGANVSIGAYFGKW